MKELIDKVENLARRVIRLETIEETRRYGTAFPASPFTGQRYFRTDRGIEYYYDGTRWLSTALMSFQLPYNANGTTFPISATLSDANRCDRPNPNYSMWLVEISYRFAVNTTFDATNNWSGALIGTNATTNPTIATLTFWQTGRTAGTAYYDTTIIGSVNAVADAWKFRIDLTKNSAPGTLVWSIPTVNYRLIG